MIDRPCPKRTRAVNVVSSDILSQHGENNKSKRRQREFIPSRLETQLWFRNYYVAYRCICIVCVKINNDGLFCNAFPFENSYDFISGYTFRRGVYYCVARVTCLVLVICSNHLLQYFWNCQQLYAAIGNNHLLLNAAIFWSAS